MRERPFHVSFAISTLVMALFLFYAPSERAHRMDDALDVFQMVDVNDIKMPKRSAKKAIDLNAEAQPPDSNEVERAEGLSEADDAVDLAFFPDVVPPRPVGKLRKVYPEEARQRDMEATVYVSLVIGREGKVLAVNVLSVRLAKPQPPEIADPLKKKFALAAVEIMSSARFTPPIIDGAKVPIVMEMPLKFQLN